MWWEPSNRNEELLAGALRQLGRWFGEQRSGEQPVAWGYGSIWSRRHQALVPFVLTNPQRGFNSGRRYSDDSVATPVDVLGRGEAERLPRLDSLLPLYALAIGRPRPSSMADELINEFIPIRNTIACVETGERGTAGIAVLRTADSKYHGLLTAGHVFPRGCGSQVVQVSRRLLRRKKTALGHVAAHVVPSGTSPGWDAAMVLVPDPFRSRAPLVRRTLDGFTSPESIVVHGAVRGSPPDAGVHGAITVVCGERMSWLNCWFIGPSGVLTGGDSGAAVFTRRQRELLGMYVASSDSRASGRPLFHYVQDAHSLELHVLRSWGVRYREDE